VPLALDALLKLCHDATALAHGALPRYFPPAAMPAHTAEPAALRAWAAGLARVVRHADHPWNEAVLADSLVGQAQRALKPAESSVGLVRATAHARRG